MGFDLCFGGIFCLEGIFCMEMRIKGVEVFLSLLLLFCYQMVCLLEDFTGVEGLQGLMLLFVFYLFSVSTLLCYLSMLFCSLSALLCFDSSLLLFCSALVWSGLDCSAQFLLCSSVWTYIFFCFSFTLLLLFALLILSFFGKRTNEILCKRGI
jgi:hypothetical protein